MKFGIEPAKMDDGLIELLKSKVSAANDAPARLFNPGERVRLTGGPFAGIEGIYQMPEGERRVMVLFELMSKRVSVGVSPAALRKLGQQSFMSGNAFLQAAGRVTIPTMQCKQAWRLSA